jgi:hypothetical protein
MSLHHRVTDEHRRQVELMLHGAWESPVFALWPAKQESVIEEVIQDTERVCELHEIGGKQ